MMTTPTPFERELGKALRAKFGSDTKVVRFGDDEGANDVFVVSGTNCPVDGVNSYGTVGLSRNAQRFGDVDIHVEIVAACAASTFRIDNLVASCVFDSIKNGTGIVYGACIADIVTQYGISRTLRHVTFVSPFPWQGLNMISLGNEVIHCLMMLLISDSEKRYLELHGIDALENLFGEKQIDIYDINRPSVLL